MTHQKYVKIFFDQPSRYLHKTFGIRVRALIARKMLDHVQYKDILDIGCGDGSISLQFLDVDTKLVLLDFSENMLALARQNCPPEHLDNVTFVNQDLLNYTSDEHFDVVLCFGVLAHVSNIDDSLKKMKNLLRPGGICVLQFTDQGQWMARLQWLIYSLHRWLSGKNGYWVNAITQNDIMASVADNGFQILDAVRYSFLFPGMGRLPDPWLYRYQLFTFEKSCLSHHGTDVVLKLIKL